MGTSHSSTQFVGKLRKAGDAMDRHRVQAVGAGALSAKTIMLAAASSRGVTPGGLIAGKKWNVRYDVRGTTNPTALVRFTGPFHLVNNPTKPHYIAAKGLGGSRSSRSERAFQASSTRFLGGSSRGAFGGARRSKGKRALSFNGRARVYVFHPGTPGKAIFPAAKAVAARTVPDVMAKSMRGAWHRALT